MIPAFISSLRLSPNVCLACLLAVGATHVRLAANEREKKAGPAASEEASGPTVKVADASAPAPLTPRVGPPSTEKLATKPLQASVAASAGEKGSVEPGDHAVASPASTQQLDMKTQAATETRSLINLGRSLTERRNFADAEIAFRQVMNAPGISPTDLRDALLGLGSMHRKQGALTKAVAIYERFLKDYPGDDRTPETLLDLGRTLRELGVHKTAIARFYSVLTSTLKLPGEGFDRYQQIAKTAQFEIAETHFQAANFAEAGKFYSRLRLLDLAPNDRAHAHFKSGYSLRLLGDLEGAVTTLRAYIEQSPEDENIPEARYLLSVSLRELKRTQEAFGATLELLKAEKSRVAQDPKRWAYWQRRTGNQLANEFFESGDTLNAQAIYAGLVELSPEPAWRLPILYQIGLCHERLGSAERARASYQTIIDGTRSKPSLSPDLAELAKMARWRLEHLGWRDQVSQEVSAFFDPSTGKKAEATVPAPQSIKTAALP